MAELLIYTIMLLLLAGAIGLFINGVSKLASREMGSGICSITAAIIFVAVPIVLAHISYTKARASARHGMCINNLRQIDGAVEQYALEYKLQEGETVSWDHVAMYIRDFSNKVYCAMAPREDRVFHQSYKLNPVGTAPECLILPVRPDGKPYHSIKMK